MFPPATLMPRFARSPRFWTIGGILAVAAGVAAAALLGFGRGSTTQAAASPKVVPPLEFVASDLTTLAARPLERTLAVSGTLVSVHQAQVKARAAAEVRSILVREGDRVKAGQVIARLDTADLAARLAERAGARDATRAQYDMAEKNRATNRSLLDKKFISQNAFDNTESVSRANRASLEAADAQVRLAQNALRDATVVAPITGIVARKYVQVGEKTALDAPLFWIVDLEALELQALVPASEVAGLTPGMAATLTVGGMPGARFRARVDRVNPATEPGTRSIVVFLTVPNPDHTLKSGMFADGTIRLAAGPPVPALPIAAVQNEAGQPVVWTIESGKLTRRAVVLGARDERNGTVEVKSGVPAGVPVLAARFENLKEGAAAVAKAEPAKNVQEKS